MSGENWTPGPWRISKDRGAPCSECGEDNFDNEWLIDRGNEPVAVAGILPDRNADANANLIAAAPDLYEALKWVADLPYAGGKRLGDVEPVKSALAKARGEDTCGQ